MKIVITGGSGFLATYLVDRLLKKGGLLDRNGMKVAIEQIILMDIKGPKVPWTDSRVRFIVADSSDRTALQDILTSDTDSVFHLAGIVSGEAEQNFDLAMQVNVIGTMNLLDVCRKSLTNPRLIFSSSIAVYGGDLPDVVTDKTYERPQTTYGAHKVVCERLIADASRKGMIDGRNVRLPVISVRPGAPNKAASGWVSSVIREPLSGVDVVCPVKPESRLPCLSPQRWADCMLKIHDLDRNLLGMDCSILLPSLSIAASEMSDAVTRLASGRKLGKIIWQLDPNVQIFQDRWPKKIQSSRAESLGLKGDESIDELITLYINDLEDKSSPLHMV